MQIEEFPLLCMSGKKYLQTSPSLMEIDLKDRKCSDLNSVISEQTDFMNSPIPVSKVIVSEKAKTITQRAKFLDSPEEF